MATEESLIKHVMVQADLGLSFTYRKMFGEYGFHLDGKFVALACDNSFFIKHTSAISENGLELPTQSPYPGAKEYQVAEELLDTPEILRRVLLDTVTFLPEPKPKLKRSTKRKV